VYCNNLTDQLGISSWSDPRNYTPQNTLTQGNYVQAIVSTPRTVGFTVAYAYKD
jgi:hypothetical protein